MLQTLFGIVMFVRLEQWANAAVPMLVTLSGIVMLVRLEQPLNAESLMIVTLLGIVMFVRLEQLANAVVPMLVTLLGIVMLVRYSHQANARSPILLTLTPFILFGITTLVTLSSQSVIVPVASSKYIAPPSTPSVHLVSVFIAQYNYQKLQSEMENIASPKWRKLQRIF